MSHSFLLERVESQANFIAQNNLELGKFALTEFQKHGKGCLVIDLEYRVLNSANNQKIEYNFPVAYTLLEKVQLPPELANYNPQTHFLISFKSSQITSRIFSIPLPKIDRPNLKYFKPKTYVTQQIPDDLIFEFVQNNYYFLAAFGYKNFVQNNSKSGMIICNLGMSCLSTKDYLKVIIKSQLDLDLLTISYDNKILQAPDKEWDKEALANYNPSLNTLMGFRLGKNLTVKLFSSPDKTNLPERCYELLTPDLKKIIDIYLQ